MASAVILACFRDLTSASRTRHWLVLLVLSLAASCSGCREAESPEAPNLLWITVDTLRSDRLGCYGHTRDTSPAIDALASRGVRFERAYATAPWTTPSITSMLTGRMPSSHGLYRTGRSLPPGIDSLPRQLANAGYRTWGIVSNLLIGKSNGFDKHFERFDESFARGERSVSTTGVIEIAERWLGELEEFDDPFLLYVHLFDPHVEYIRHRDVGYAAERGGVLTGEESFRILRKHAERVGEAERSFLLDLYDEEVRFTDNGIALLLERLDELGLTDSTLIVMTSDHGEEIFERGWIGHTRTLFEELVRVPLIFAGPGVPEGRTVAEPVSLVELPEALRQLLFRNASASPDRLAARVLDLAPPADPPPVVFEVDFIDLRNPEREAHFSSIVRGQMKLIRNDKSGELALFNLEKDPRERRNLAERRAEKVAELEVQLDQALAKLRIDPLPIHERQLDEDELEALEGLGYVGEDSE